MEHMKKLVAVVLLWSVWPLPGAARETEQCTTAVVTAQASTV
jgi:hypothetical protein